MEISISPTAQKLNMERTETWKCVRNILYFPTLRMLALVLCKVLLKFNICWILLLEKKPADFLWFWIFKISLNLRGHKESAEEEVLYSSQPTEGKYHFLQLSQLHLLISLDLSSPGIFLFYVVCKEEFIFFIATSFSVSSYLQSPN